MDVRRAGMSTRISRIGRIAVENDFQLIRDNPQNQRHPCIYSRMESRDRVAPVELRAVQLIASVRKGHSL